MRTIPQIAAVFVIAAFIAACPAFAQRLPDLKDGVRDEQGHVRWMSSVEETRSNAEWKYWHEVENLSTSDPCRVQWDVHDFLLNIPPTLLVPGGPVTAPLRPRNVQRPITWNGPAPGFGKKDTMAWAQNDPKDHESPIEASAKIVVERGGVYYMLSASGRSHLNDEKPTDVSLTYELTIRPWTPEKTPVFPVSSDLISLIEEHGVQVEWDSIASDRWQEVKAERGEVRSSKIIKFAFNKEDDGHVLRFLASLPAVRPLKVSSKSLSFVDPKKEGEERVLAKVWFPAYAP